jgi:hypothetical protein
VAAKSVDRDLDLLAGLADHANRLVGRFIEISGKDRQRAEEMLIELEHVINEFRRLRPAPLFRKDRPLHLVIERSCAICQVSIESEDRQFFETPGAVYHVDCYEREIGKPKYK